MFDNLGPLSTLVLLTLLSAASMWGAHNLAHVVYGANQEAVGSVGVVVFVFAGVGTYLAIWSADQRWSGSGN